MYIQQLESYRINVYDVKDQLKQHVYGRSLAAFAEGDRSRDAIVTKGQLESRNREMREKLLASLGGLPSSDTPLDPQLTGTVRGDGFRIENIIFQSRPHHYVTANLYVPDGTGVPRGAVLFVCGHHELAKHHEEYQTVCQYLVKVGLVVLSFDPLGQGERFGYYEPAIGKPTVDWGTAEHDHVGSQCWPLGDSLARYFVHDAMRAVDYLCTRPEVDAAKIGITGNSGGGLQTAMMMVCDPRIAAAAPATFIMNRESYLFSGQAQDAEQIWPGMTAWGFDHEDLLLALAPRPVLVLAVTYDFFPIEGTRRTVERARRFWEMYGKQEHIGLVEDCSTHKYTKQLAQAAAVFFAKHLLDGEQEKGASHSKAAVSALEIKPFAPSSLWCTQSGQVREQFPDTRFVYEENVSRLAECEAQREDLAEEKRKAAAIAWLRLKVTTGRDSCELNPRLETTARLDELLVQSWVWWSQKGVFNHAYLFRDDTLSDGAAPITIAIWDGGTGSVQPHHDWIRETCRQGRAAMVLDVTGTGALTPNAISSYPLLKRYGTIHKFVADLIWLDDSLAAMRVYDVLRALDMAELLAGTHGRDIRLYAHGRYSLYAQLARALDARASRLDVVNGMESVGQWVRSRHYDPHDRMSLIMPGMLRHFDLPDLARWFPEKAAPSY